MASSTTPSGPAHSPHASVAGSKSSVSPVTSACCPRPALVTLGNYLGLHARLDHGCRVGVLPKVSYLVGTLVVVLGCEQVGSPESLLIIIRGPSGAGKSSVADAVRRRHGRGLSVLGQDLMRRQLLWEKKDLPGGLAPSFITHSAGFLLDAGWPVIVDGILSATFYGPALRDLIVAHRGRTLLYFLQVELAETFTRHASRPEAAVFSTADMASWFEPDDRLGVPGEVVIPQTSSLRDTVEWICQEAQIIDRHLGHRKHA